MLTAVMLVSFFTEAAAGKKRRQQHNIRVLATHPNMLLQLQYVVELHPS